MSDTEKLKLCGGCRNDYYNQPGHSTTGKCWMLGASRVVQRTRVGTWQNPPYRWQPVKTLSCHHPEGSAWIAIDDVRIVRASEVVAKEPS